jgi:hypothetical protein
MCLLGDIKFGVLSLVKRNLKDVDLFLPCLSSLIG